MYNSYMEVKRFHQGKYRRGFLERCVQCNIEFFRPNSGKYIQLFCSRKCASNNQKKKYGDSQICSKCKIQKPLSEFSRHGNIFKTICKKCSKQYWEKWYSNKRNRRKSLERNKLRNKAVRQQHRTIIADLKTNTPCYDCGLLYPPYVMDFDHREGTIKVGNIGDLKSRGISEARLREEIAKCDLVCANCHRIRTNNRRLKNIISINTITSARP